MLSLEEIGRPVGSCVLKESHESGERLFTLYGSKTTPPKSSLISPYHVRRFNVHVSQTLESRESQLHELQADFTLTHFINRLDSYSASFPPLSTL